MQQLLTLFIVIQIFFTKTICLNRIEAYICSPKKGVIAQLVEQRTENPCVPSSILGGTTCTRALNIHFKALVILGYF